MTADITVPRKLANRLEREARLFARLSVSGRLGRRHKQRYFRICDKLNEARNAVLAVLAPLGEDDDRWDAAYARMVEIEAQA